ncbi:MAG: shikimate dehydrogenase, partial [Rhodoferax sp.]|nr:shikimate dehydrogenase [Rhodoferax sp.]
MANKFVMAGVMGWPVAHSRSPVIHNHWIRQYGLQGAYGLFPVQPGKLEDAIRGLPALGLAGCNVTIPHKVDAMKLMD